MKNRIYLFILELRLRRYKRDSKYYEKTNNYSNFYHEYGIPKLEEEIKLIKHKINKTR